MAGRVRVKYDNKPGDDATGGPGKEDSENTVLLPFFYQVKNVPSTEKERELEPKSRWSESLASKRPLHSKNDEANSVLLRESEKGALLGAPEKGRGEGNCRDTGPSDRPGPRLHWYGSRTKMERKRKT